MRTEETSLLPEDEARRLPLDEIIMVVDAQMPVRAKRIQYFDDRLFAAIHGAQKGELPFPMMGGGGAGGSGSNGTKPRPEARSANVLRDEVIVGKEEEVAASAQRVSSKTAHAVQAVVAEERRQMEMDFAERSAMTAKEPNDAETKQFVEAVDELGDFETSLEKRQTH